MIARLIYIHRMREFKIVGIAVWLFLLPAAAIAQETVTDRPPSSILFETLKRVYYGFDFHEKKQPNYYFETVQPLYQDKQQVNTLSVQPRLNLRSGKNTVNLGVGYRRLMDNRALLGGNVFWDWRKQNNHARVGFGLEFLTRLFESRANAYFGVTSPRIVKNLATVAHYERVPTGFDYEIGTRIPYLTFAKVFFGQSFFNLKYTRDYNRRQGRLELKPFSFGTFNLYLIDDSQVPAEVRLDFRISLSLEDMNQIKLSAEPYPEIDLKKMTLQRVERDHNIFVESYGINKATGMIVEIGRGS